jgi:Tfp pilus assembly PilM family ATPase
VKIRIDVDCTPQEARTFLGLPHIEPMQDALVAQLQERLAHYLAAMDPEAMLKLWLPGGMQGLAQLQERIWSQFMSGMTGAAQTVGRRCSLNRSRRTAF